MSLTYYKKILKSYEEFKKSKDYKEHKLTETEYVQAMHQTRAFEYVSIDDEKSKIEMWRDIALGVGLVVLTIFCPPAGAVAGVALASADMYSAATGKDWGTGRELDATERTLRGTFALFDLIPAGKYLGTLAKTGKTAGLTAVKSSLKTTLKEGLEQGAKNLDSFKVVLKNAKGLGDNVYHSLSTYRKQITHQLKNSVDEKVLNLSKATQEGLERAKQFTLEVPTVRVIQEASTGRQMMQFETTSKSLGDTGLGKSLDNLASKAKHVENTRLDRLRARNAFYGNKVDDVLEAGSKVGKDIDGKIFGRLELANKSHPKTGIKFDQEGFPIFDSFGDMYLEPEDYLKSRGTHFDRASKDLYQQIMANDELARRFTQEEIELFKKSSVPKRFTWHHHQEPGLMQLVDRRIHRQTGHIGGYSIWGKGN